ncbi:hypothetical protein BSKO_02903 [Bryopsis sp. KO-2023]|nr:hypothetical protein BSKO_02903 [Bryopsis sp. KO-2023]
MPAESLCTTLFLLCLLTAASGLFEDQQGKNDWYKGSIGRVFTASLHSKKARLSVGTDANIVATLNLRDGDILWRREFGADDVLSGVVVVEKTSTVISLSGGGVRAWDQLHGGLVWERPLGSAASYNGSLGILSDGGDGEPIVVLLYGRVLKALDVVDGEDLWSVNLLKEKIGPLETGSISIRSDGVDVGLLEKGTGRVGLVSVSDMGIVEKEHIFESQAGLSKHLVMSGAVVGITTTDGSELCIGVHDSNGELNCHDTGMVENGEIYASGCGLVALSANGEPGFAHIFANGHHKLKGVTALSAIVGDEEKQLAATIQYSDEGLLLSIVDTLSSELPQVHSETFKFEVKGTVGRVGIVDQVFLGVYARKDNTVGYRALVIGENGAMALLQQGQVVWKREEGLASLQASIFIDPPASATADVEKLDMMQKIKNQILMTKIQFNLHTEEEQSLYKAQAAKMSGHTLNSRDSNGIRKLIVVLGASQVYALHSGDGRIIWSRLLNRDAPATRMFLWRYSHNLQGAPWIVLLSQSAYSVLDAHTGALIEHHSLPEKFEKVIPFPKVLKVGDSDQHLFLLVEPFDKSASPKVTLIPDVSGARSILKDALDEIHVWHADKPGGTLKGYGLDVGTMTLLEQWTLAFHSPILAALSRDPSDAVHSHVKVLGDRTLKFKYLNPNTVMIASGLADGSSSVAEDSELSIHIIDTVTGRILHRQIHPAARGPVHAVFSQHWVVYHYFSMQNGRFETSTLEMYDASHKDVDIFGLMFAKNEGETISSHEPAPLEILSSTHFMATPLKAMGVTRTSRGITTQHVLFGTVADQVYSMDKRFLDPRRPRGKITAEAREERLIPFQENLPMYPTKFATQNRHIVGLKHIESSPTGLESGSHIFAYGIDLFYTRVQPEKAFDSLEEDFAFAFLVLTIVGMLVGAVVMHHMVKRSKLAQKWK